MICASPRYNLSFRLKNDGWYRVALECSSCKTEIPWPDRLDEHLSINEILPLMDDYDVVHDVPAGPSVAVS